MARFRSGVLLAAFVLLAACAAQKPVHRGAAAGSRRPEPRTAQKPADGAAAKPQATRAEKNRALAEPDKDDALTPREIGYFLDILQGRLQQQLDPGVIVGRERGGIVLDFSRRIGFAAASAQLDPAERTLLLPLAKVLVEYRAAQVSVRVSAEDDAGAARKLAQERANGLVRTLKESGIAATRMVAVVPSAAARDGEAHVEIVLVPETRGN